ncbi:unnamed protein product, partial [Hapterophycus canaliculatus]
ERPSIVDACDALRGGGVSPVFRRHGALPPSAGPPEAAALRETRPGARPSIGRFRRRGGGGGGKRGSNLVGGRHGGDLGGRSWRGDACGRTRWGRGRRQVPDWTVEGLLPGRVLLRLRLRRPQRVGGRHSLRRDGRDGSGRGCWLGGRGAGGRRTAILVVGGRGQRCRGGHRRGVPGSQLGGHDSRDSYRGRGACGGIAEQHYRPLPRHLRGADIAQGRRPSSAQGLVLLGTGRRLRCRKPGGRGNRFDPATTGEGGWSQGGWPGGGRGGRGGGAAGGRGGGAESWFAAEAAAAAAVVGEWTGSVFGEEAEQYGVMLEAMLRGAVE